MPPTQDTTVANNIDWVNADRPAHQPSQWTAINNHDLPNRRPSLPNMVRDSPLALESSFAKKRRKDTSSRNLSRPAATTKPPAGSETRADTVGSRNLPRHIRTSKPPGSAPAKSPEAMPLAASEALPKKSVTTSSNKRKRVASKAESDGDVASTSQPAKRRASAEKDKAQPKDQSDLCNTTNDQNGDQVNNGRTFTAGKFTTEEFAAIDEAISDIRDQNNFTQQEVNDIVQGNIAKLADTVLTLRGFWRTITDALPHRTSKSTQKAVRRKYHNFQKRGVFSAEDDEELLENYKIFPNKWAEIGKAMNRYHEDIRDRYRNYLATPERNGDLWTGEEEQQLLSIIDEVRKNARKSHRRKMREGKTNEVFDPDQIAPNYILASERMGGARSRLQIANKWKKLLAEQRRAEDALQSGEESSGDQIVPRKVKYAKSNYDTKMQIGDKYRCLKVTLDAMVKYSQTKESKIPWGAIQKANRSSRWGTPERKVVFQNTKTIVQLDPNASALDALKAGVRFMEKNYTKQELATFYEAPVSTPRKSKPAPTSTQQKSKPRKTTPKLSLPTVVSSDSSSETESDKSSETKSAVPTPIGSPNSSSSSSSRRSNISSSSSSSSSSSDSTSDGTSDSETESV